MWRAIDLGKAPKDPEINELLRLLVLCEHYKVLPGGGGLLDQDPRWVVRLDMFRRLRLQKQELDGERDRARAEAANANAKAGKPRRTR